MTRFAALILVVAACGGGGGKAIDAPLGPSVLEDVDCSTITPNATITTDDSTMVYAGSPATISMGQVVEFKTSANHDVTPDTNNSDPRLSVPFSTTKCKMFLGTGTFGFHCSVHGFTGTINVQ